MSLLVLGNIVCFIGSLFMFAGGILKKKNTIITVQCFQFGILAVGNLLLGGISGFVSDILSLVRNLVCIKREYTQTLKIIFIALQVILTAIFNNLGLVGWLPTLAACIFTWCLDTKNVVLLKALIILAQLMWAIFDLSIRNYSTLAFDVATVVSNLVGIYRVLRGKQSGEPGTV